MNLALIRMPKACIDYVIAHELCHLVEHNHGKPCFALLGRVMPDWETRRRRLNDVLASVLERTYLELRAQPTADELDRVAAVAQRISE